ncbi:GNAT family N-acetyltransferase [uncultured Alsobacter sp.]|uniref:GNAT family N-acetyltransferase n=1 Tax=uncultured Alsobacter sp. TaxID=1748258 RepID=UPI0025CE41D8|nr:GNAT family N-acetyltransferase [uncultured Alsobacter sp.]
MTSHTAATAPLSRDIRIGPLTVDRLGEAVSLSRQAQWPHRLEDWALVLAQSRGLAALDGERLVGTALATPFGADGATVNMVLVDESLRGRGIGRLLMDRALAAVEGREQRLIATREGLPLYEKLGFRRVGDIVQHQGPVPGVAGTDGRIAWDVEPQAIASLSPLDRMATGFDRATMLAALAAVGRVAVLRQDGTIRGFAVLRAFGRGEVVGPVVAQTTAEAKALVEAAFARCTSGFVRVDTPDPALGTWLAERGLPAVGGGVAMVRHAQPRQTSSFQTYALASQALG